MRSIIEQVDEFIEGVFDGSLILLTSLGATQRNKEGKSIDQDTLKFITKLTREFIPEYMEETNKVKKHQIARRIFGVVMTLREFGDVRNNPDSLAELTRYKTENTKLREENQVLRKNVQNLTAKIMSYEGVVDKKVGVV